MDTPPIKGTSSTVMRALVCGISGQDGAYLARYLLEKGYEVTGTSRDAGSNPFAGLTTLGVHDRVKLVSMTLDDFDSVLRILDRTRPDEIYNLAGQSSAAVSFEQPIETFESIAVGTLNLLEAIRVRRTSGEAVQRRLVRLLWRYRRRCSR